MNEVASRKRFSPLTYPLTNQSFPFAAYVECVLYELETIDYPELVIGFEADAVVDSMMKSIEGAFTRNINPRMCAIIIWSLTMNFQVMRPVSANQLH